MFDEPSVIALADAIKNEDLPEIDRIVSSGVDINTGGRDNVSPLGWALMVNKKAAFQRLLERGADPNRMVWNSVPLISITAKNDTDSDWLESALKHKGDPNIVNSVAGIPNGKETPIFNAVRSRNKKNLELLIKAGADLNHRKYNDNTPLMVCCVYATEYDTALLLLEAGADYQIPDGLGNHVTYWIATSRVDPAHERWKWREKVIDFLEAKGVDFDAETPHIEDPDIQATWKAYMTSRREAKKKD